MKSLQSAGTALCSTFDAVTSTITKVSLIAGSLSDAAVLQSQRLTISSELDLETTKLRAKAEKVQLKRKLAREYVIEGIQDDFAFAKSIGIKATSANDLTQEDLDRIEEAENKAMKELFGE